MCILISLSFSLNMLQLHPRKRDKSSPFLTFEFIHRQMGVKFIPLCTGISTQESHGISPIFANQSTKETRNDNLLRSRVPLFVKLWTGCDRLLLQLRNRGSSASERSIESAVVGIKSGGSDTNVQKLIITKSFNLELWDVDFQLV